ncbi:MAG TPA: hypothetical protein VMV92_17090 [Streptosporangiaceae bacterium]|nr:hypothetical protein [Streptosporangiaceae bacterium]
MRVAMNPARSHSTRPCAPPSAVLVAVISSVVPARTVTSRPPGRTAASQLAGTGLTDTSDTMRS